MSSGSAKDGGQLDRRAFFRAAGGAAATLPVLATPVPASAQAAPASAAQAPAPTPAAAAAPAARAGWQSLGTEAGAFLEALVDHMWPGDALSPSGTEIGIQVYIDRQLAGAFGQGDRLYMQGPFRPAKPQHGWQVAMTPEQFFKAGIEAAGQACRARHAGRSFDRLQPAEREAFLADLASGRVTAEGVDLGSWFNGLVYPLFLQGAYADPIYGGNRDKAAWRMIGYPGLPATYTPEEIREHRGKRHPNAADPQSIADLS